MAVLGLHRQYCVEADYEPRSFFMEIRTTVRPFPLNDQSGPGHIELHYMELDVTQHKTGTDHIDGKSYSIPRTA